ncbi:MAG: hypothetical protein GTO20_03210 [Candidatus Aminicenantes bacterium]|nr:hypothetical protein [Candidatus Aminicenantes bacterium]
MSHLKSKKRQKLTKKSKNSAKSAQTLDNKFDLNYYLFMIVGFNTDIKYRDEVFHIQTEDKGESNPTVETLVYHSGEILLSRRISYSHLLKKSDARKRIKDMMKTQHEQVILELKGGKFLHLLSLDTQVVNDMPLDEMVLDYLDQQESISE